MALHAGADQAHLREPFDVVAIRRGTVERGLGVAPIAEWGREHDLVAGLDDRVDVDARFGERGEEVGAVDRLDAVDGLVERVGNAGDDRLLKHPLVFLGDPGAVAVAERRANMQLDAVVSRDLDRA